MFVSFGDGKEALYGRILAAPVETFGFYKIEVLQPKRFAGEVKLVNYNCLKFGNPSLNPLDWEKVTDSIRVEICRVSTKGVAVFLLDNRLSPAKIIGSFLPSGYFLFFDDFVRRNYLITVPSSNGSLTKKQLATALESEDLNLSLGLDGLSCFEVFTEREIS